MRISQRIRTTEMEERKGRKNLGGVVRKRGWSGDFVERRSSSYPTGGTKVYQNRMSYYHERNG